MKILVISNYYDPLAYLIAKSFMQSFIAIGHESIIKDKYESGYDMCLTMYTHVQYDFPKDNTCKVAYNWESLHHKMWHRRVVKGAEQFDYVWDSSESNLQIQLPTKHIHCPIGYHSSFELECVLQKQKQKVAFIGLVSRKSRRFKIIKKIEQDLGLNVWCICDRKKQIHTKKLADRIWNTDIHLNIHRNLPTMESVRIIAMLLNNKQFIVSEPNQDSPLINGKHFIETQKLSETIIYYLEHPQERQQIAQCGYDFIKTQYRFEDHIAECFRRMS